MSYVALYRVWRPARWEDVVGQNAAVRILKNALGGHKLSHAYLFSGPRGTGKTSVARLLAKSVNCPNISDEGEPCNTCESCVAITSGSSVDVSEIDAASNRGIDEMRSLREGIRYLPVSGTHRVYIIDEAHMLTQEAFNALLKTLEEPPSHVIFVLATTAPHKIPVTIASRCQRLDFHRLSITDIERQMQKILSSDDAAHLSWEDGALRIIARAADGSMRDALSVLDLCLTYNDREILEKDVREIIGDVGADVMIKLFTAVAQRDLKGILDITGAMSDRGKDMGELSYEIGAFARDLLLLRSGAKAVDVGRPDGEAQRMRILSSAVEPSCLVAIMDAVGKAVSSMRQSDDPRLTLEMTLLGVFLERGVSLEVKPTPKKAEVRVEKPEEEIREKGEHSDPLDTVKDSWAKMLDEMFRRRKVKVRAFLLHASPVRMEGDKVLVLSYPKGSSVLMEQILAPENKKVVEEYLEMVTGLKLSVSAEISNNTEEHDDGLHPLVKAAVDLVNGEIVE